MSKHVVPNNPVTNIKDHLNRKKVNLFPGVLQNIIKWEEIMTYKKGDHIRDHPSE